LRDHVAGSGQLCVLLRRVGAEHAGDLDFGLSRYEKEGSDAGGDERTRQPADPAPPATPSRGRAAIDGELRQRSGGEFLGFGHGRGAVRGRQKLGCRGLKRAASGFSRRRTQSPRQRVGRRSIPGPLGRVKRRTGGSSAGEGSVMVARRRGVARLVGGQPWGPGFRWRCIRATALNTCDSSACGWRYARFEDRRHDEGRRYNPVLRGFGAAAGDVELRIGVDRRGRSAAGAIPG